MLSGWAHRRKVPEAVIMERYRTYFAVRRLRADMGKSPIAAHLALPGVTAGGAAKIYTLSTQEKTELTIWNATQTEPGRQLLR